MEIDEFDYVQLYEAIDDLWGCLGTAEVEQLHSETRLLAMRIHEILWHKQSYADEAEEEQGRLI